MNREQQQNTITRQPRGWKHKLAVLVIVFSLVLAPRPSQANFTDCEFPFMPWIASAILIVIQTAAIYAAFWPPDGSVPEALEEVTTQASDELLGGELTGEVNVNISFSVIPDIDLSIDTGDDFRFGGLQWMDEQFRGRLDKFWVDLKLALEGMSAQFHSSAVNVARIMSSNTDGEVLSKTQLTEEDQELKSKDENTVSDEACVFDTVAQASAKATKTSSAISSAMSTSLATVSNNKAGSESATGRGGFVASRFSNLKNKFCDPNANGGNAPCSTAGTMPNAHIMPSRTLFEKPTIDMVNADTRMAVNELVYNLTGYIPPETIPETTLESAEGKEIRQINREYSAKMDAVSSLVWGIVGERTPGPANQHIQNLRLQAGAAHVSANPSEREIRMAITEQLWNPKYYANLGDSANTIGQKDLYLKAYSSVLLHKLIEKTERISTVYAIETADLLKTMPGASISTIQYAPLN